MPAAARELAGLRVAVTASRRADELAGMVERHGAEVVRAPALRVAPVDEEGAVADAARRLVDEGADVVVVTTGYGLRRWLSVADSAGVGEAFTQALTRARILCRGTKARGAAVGLGLAHAEAGGATTPAVVEQLLAEGVEGRRIVLQAHAQADEQSVDALTGAGALVEVVSPYRWVDADEDSRLPTLVRDVVERRVQVITFSAAPAVEAVLDAARTAGLHDEFLQALRSGEVLCAVFGPVTAAPLRELGIDPVVPERHRTGAMVKALCARVAERR